MLNQRGGMYHCITTFDFSEEGKLKWSAINRVSQFGIELPDLSADLVKIKQISYFIASSSVEVYVT